MFSSSFQNNKKQILSAALLAGTLLGASALAFAQADAPPSGPRHGEFARGPSGEGGWHRGHRGGGAFMHQLKALDLSDAQRETIRGYFKAAHEQRGGNGNGDDAMRAARRSFDTTAPGSAGYGTVVAQMSDAAANAAREHVQRKAALRAQIYSVLTDAQKSKLASDLASLPEPKPR